MGDSNPNALPKFAMSRSRENFSCQIKKNNHSSFLIPISNSYLSDLLPYNPKEKIRAQLRSSLKEYQFLLKACLEAISAFTAAEFEKF